jgi:hypothetical protein
VQFGQALQCILQRRRTICISNAGTAAVTFPDQNLPIGLSAERLTTNVRNRYALARQSGRVVMEAAIADRPAQIEAAAIGYSRHLLAKTEPDRGTPEW